MPYRYPLHAREGRKENPTNKDKYDKVEGRRLSIIQWETLGTQIANSINNLPTGLGKNTQYIENLDILTPNRLILGGNNNRAPPPPPYLLN